MFNHIIVIIVFLILVSFTYYCYPYYVCHYFPLIIAIVFLLLASYTYYYWSYFFLHGFHVLWSYISVGVPPPKVSDIDGIYLHQNYEELQHYVDKFKFDYILAHIWCYYHVRFIDRPF
jgi:hypothetical protein